MPSSGLGQPVPQRGPPFRGDRVDPLTTGWFPGDDWQQDRLMHAGQELLPGTPEMMLDRTRASFRNSTSSGASECCTG